MMLEPLEVTVDLAKEKVRFTGVAKDNPAITIDYTPPLGDGQGYTSLELLLISLASCSGTSVVMMLRKMQKTVSGLSVNARGTRRDQHPTALERIQLEFLIHSPDVADADMQKALRLSEDTYCPVWAMLKHAAEITSEYRILAPLPEEPGDRRPAPSFGRSLRSREGKMVVSPIGERMVMLVRVFVVLLLITCVVTPWCRGEEPSPVPAPVPGKPAIIRGPFAISADSFTWEYGDRLQMTAKDAVEMKLPLLSQTGEQKQIIFDAASLVIETDPQAAATPGDPRESKVGYIVSIKQAAMTTCALPAHRHYEMVAKTVTIYHPSMRFVARNVAVRVAGIHLMTLSKLSGSLAEGKASIPHPSFGMGNNSADGAYVKSKLMMDIGDNAFTFSSRIGTEKILRGNLALSRPITMMSDIDGKLSLMVSYNEEISNRLSDTRNITISRLPAVQFRASNIPLPITALKGFNLRAGAAVGRYHEEPSDVTRTRAQAWSVIDSPRYRIGGLEIFSSLGMQGAVNGSQPHHIGTGLLSVGTPENADVYLNATYLHRRESGSTPFLFDRVDIRNELFTEADLPLGKKSPWRLNVINRFDLDRRRSRALEVTAIFRDDCFSYGLTYDSVTHGFNLGVVINGLDTFRSGGKYIGFPQ